MVGTRREACRAIWNAQRRAVKAGAQYLSPFNGNSTLQFRAVQIWAKFFPCGLLYVQGVGELTIILSPIWKSSII